MNEKSRIAYLPFLLCVVATTKKRGLALKVQENKNSVKTGTAYEKTNNTLLRQWIFLIGNGSSTN